MSTFPLVFVKYAFLFIAGLEEDPEIGEQDLALDDSRDATFFELGGHLLCLMGSGDGSPAIQTSMVMLTLLVSSKHFVPAHNLHLNRAASLFAVHSMDGFLASAAVDRVFIAICKHHNTETYFAGCRLTSSRFI